MTQLEELISRAEQYIAKRRSKDKQFKFNMDLTKPLGHGTDGSVWSTNRNSAVKVIAKEKSYQREKQCYQHLAEKGIRAVDGLSIPTLIDYDDHLMIVEVDIVQPPYLLDFGKAYINEVPPFTSEQLAEYYGSLGEKFRKFDIPRIRKICRILSGLGIEYLDARPSNIRLRTDAEERLLPDDDWEKESTDIESIDDDPQ